MANAKLTLPMQINLEHFISIQAHDLRAPFNTIVGFSKMLLNNLGDSPHTDLQKEDLATVYRSGQRALLLMNGLIDIARIKRREKGLSLAEIEIKPLLEQSLAQWKKLNLGLESQAEYHILTSSPTLHADEQQLRQILAGFILYAAQYTEPPAKITLTIEEEPKCFVLTVTSAGRKVRPFAELDLEMQGYINRALIKLHRGKIRLAEETDDGASIQFTLPKK